MKTAGVSIVLVRPTNRTLHDACTALLSVGIGRIFLPESRHMTCRP